MKLSSPQLVLLALILTGCGQTGSSASGAVSQGQQLPAPPVGSPTLGALPPPPTGTGEGMHTDFRRAFQDGLVIDQPDETLQISVIQGGRLQLSSGVVLVGDPGWAEGLQALPVGIPRGKYRVQLSRVRGEDKTTGEIADSVAALRLLLAPHPAARWLYLATCQVDSGAAAFLSPTAAELMSNQQQESAQRYKRRRSGDEAPEPADTIDSRLQDRFATDLVSPVVLQSHPRGPFDVAVASSGFGGGSYDVYVGLDEAGAVVELVVDFAVLLEPVYDRVTIEDVDALPPGPIDLGALASLGIRADHGRATETWLTIDASALWSDPLSGRPEVVVQGPDGRELDPRMSMVGGHHRIDAPRVAHAQVTIKVRVGVTPL